MNDNDCLNTGFECPCPSKKCENYGNCEKCKAHYSHSKRQPFCKREHGFLEKLFYRKYVEQVRLLKAEGLI